MHSPNDVVEGLSGPVLKSRLGGELRRPPAVNAPASCRTLLQLTSIQQGYGTNESYTHGSRCQSQNLSVEWKKSSKN